LERGLLILGAGDLVRALSSAALSYGILPVILAEKEDLGQLIKSVELLTSEDRIVISYRGREFYFALDRAIHELRRRGLSLKYSAFMEEIRLPLILESMLDLSEERLEELFSMAFSWAFEAFRKIISILGRIDKGGVMLISLSLAGDYPMEYQAPLSLASSSLKTMVRSLRLDPLVKSRQLEILMAYPGLADPSLRRAMKSIEEKELLRIASSLIESMLSPPAESEEKPIPFGKLEVFR